MRKDAWVSFEGDESLRWGSGIICIYTLVNMQSPLYYIMEGYGKYCRMIMDCIRDCIDKDC